LPTGPSSRGLQDPKKRGKRHRRPETVGCEIGKLGVRENRRLYDDGAYRKAIRKACKKAGVPTWFPHQLRHAAATEFRRRYGLEASQAVLGHSELTTTQIYAAVDCTTARRVMAEIG
jgi:integrase